MDAYERLKDATLGQMVTRELIANLITASHEIPDTVKAELLDLSGT